MSWKMPHAASEAEGLAKDAKQFWALRNQRMADVQTAWELPTAPTQDREETVTVNDLRVQHNKAAALLSGKPFEIEVAARNDAQRQVAQKVKDWLHWVRDEFELRYIEEGNNPLYYDEVQWPLLRGWLAARLLLRPDQQDSAMFQYDLLDPMNVFPRGAGGRSLYIAHIYYPRVADVLAEFGKVAERMLGDRDLKGQVHYIALYSDAEMGVLIDGEWMIKPHPHDYGFNPVTCVRFGGAPYRTTEFQQLWQGYAGVGLLDAMLQSVADKQALATIGRTLLAKAAAPPSVLFSASGATENDIPMGPNERSVRPLGEQLIQLPPDTQALALQNVMLSLVQSGIDRAGLGQALFGSPEGAGSGFAANEARGANTDVLRPYVMGLARFYQIHCRNLVRLFATFGDAARPYVARGPDGLPTADNLLDPREVAGTDTLIRIRFRSLDVPDRMANAQMATMLADRKIISRETARSEFVDVPNPSAEDERIQDEGFLDDPEITKLLTLMRLATSPNGNPAVPPLAGLLLQKAIMDLQASLQPPPPPGLGPGGPPSPGGMPQQPPIPGVGVPNHIQPDELGPNAGAGPGGSLPGLAAPQAGLPNFGHPGP